MRPETWWMKTREQNHDAEVDCADADGDHRRPKRGHCRS